MEYQLAPIILILIFFIISIVLIANEKIDSVPIFVLMACFTVFVIDYYYPTHTGSLFSGSDMNTILFLVFMQIVIKIAEENKIFQYLAIKSIHITKANPRTFFYLICIISSISGAIMSDAMIVIIYMPLVIRATKILKIDPTPFMLGVLICMNLGFLIAPISPQNLVIAQAFNLTFSWFFLTFSPLAFLALFATIWSIDYLYVTKTTKTIKGIATYFDGNNGSEFGLRK